MTAWRTGGFHAYFYLSLRVFRHFFCGRLVKHLLLFLFRLEAMEMTAFPLRSQLAKFGLGSSRSNVYTCLAKGDPTARSACQPIDALVTKAEIDSRRCLAASDWSVAVT